MAEKKIPEFQTRKHKECADAGKHLGNVMIRDRNDTETTGYACTHCGALNVGEGKRPEVIEIVE